MAIGTPTLVGAQLENAPGGVTSYTVSVATAAPAGALLVVLAQADSSVTITVTDSKSNSYTSNATVTTTGEFRGAILTCPNCTALTTSDTITIHYSGSVFLASAVVVYVTGIVTSSPLDVSHTGTATSTTAASGTTATTAQAAEIAFGQGVGQHTGTFTYAPTTPAGWTALTSEQGNDGTFQYPNFPYYKILSATGTQSISITSFGSASDDNGALIACYKGAAAAADPFPAGYAQATLVAYRPAMS